MTLDCPKCGAMACSCIIGFDHKAGSRLDGNAEENARRLKIPVATYRAIVEIVRDEIRREKEAIKS